MTDLHDRACRVIPGGINSLRREITPPLAIEEARGSHVRDSDGRTYIDLHCAYGAIILGHGDPEFAKDVTAGMLAVDLVGLGVTRSEVQLAEKLVHHVPAMERVLLCNSGSEATLHAVHAARAATGRTDLLKFSASFHGTHDAVLWNGLSPLVEQRGQSPSYPMDGISADVMARTHVAHYNDLDSVRTILDAIGNHVAAIIVEPFGHNLAGAEPTPEFLAGLRALATKHRCVLIADEVVTGLRHGLGGFMNVAGIRPDLVTMAKALGNGLPIGAIGGRTEIMEQFHTLPSGSVVYSGTSNGNGAAVGAALSVLGRLEQPDAYEHMWSLGDSLRNGLREVFAARDVPAYIGGINGIVHTSFTDRGPIRDQADVVANDDGLYRAYRQEMRAHGVLDSPETQCRRSHVALSLSAADVADVLDAADQSLAAALTYAPPSA